MGCLDGLFDGLDDGLFDGLFDGPFGWVPQWPSLMGTLLVSVTLWGTCFSPTHILECNRLEAGDMLQEQRLVGQMVSACGARH
jgi:hypothetical protein